jgi:hypothetical protein
MKELYSLIVGSRLYVSTDIVSINEAAITHKHLGRVEIIGRVKQEVKLQSFKLWK